jgi:two-component system, OmpR family, phosphate regulon response regulator PhoB
MESINSNNSAILLVDDDEDWRLQLKLAIEEVDFDALVLEAATLNEARFYTENSHENGWPFAPDLIYLDPDMPDGEGIDLLRELKSNDFTRHIPVIAWGTIDDGQTSEAMIEAGADAFFVKPYDPDKIIETLRKTSRLRARPLTETLQDLAL